MGEIEIYNRSRGAETDLEPIETSENELEVERKMLTFTLDKEQYGVQAECVTEIVGVLPITEVPELPDYVGGIINLRGRIIPVIDVRLKFGKPFKVYGDRTSTIIIEREGIQLGLIVDAVRDVVNLNLQQVIPYEGTEEKYVRSIVKMTEGLVMMIDCDLILGIVTLELSE